MTRRAVRTIWCDAIGCASWAEDSRDESASGTWRPAGWLTLREGQSQITLDEARRATATPEDACALFFAKGKQFDFCCLRCLQTWLNTDV